MITFVRRRGLGIGLWRTVIPYLTDHHGIPASQWKTWRNSGSSVAGTTLFMRWGCTATLPARAPVLNKAASIHRVNNKGMFAQELSMHGLSPTVEIFSEGDVALSTGMVLRPMNHSRGRNIIVTERDGVHYAPWDGYARPLIKKAAEYRVYVLFGKVAAVAEKIPEDRDAVAWNHAHGVPFRNVRWGQWPLSVCTIAQRGAALSGLDYAAVDVMVEEDTATPWIIEINSAGSLPANADGSISYRARCVADCLAYHYKTGSYQHLTTTDDVSNWKDVAHPSLLSDRD